MKFSQLKKIALASALTLAAAFNMTSCRSAREVVEGRQVSPTAGLPSDSIHREFDGRGEMTSLARYRGGLLNDGPNGEPAYLELNFEGNVVVAERYADGKLNDGENGEPAVLEFNDNGMISHVEFYKRDFLDDGIHGDPAFQNYDDEGRLTLAIRYRKGEMTRILTQEECADYQASRHPEKKKAPPAPKNFRHFRK